MPTYLLIGLAAVQKTNSATKEKLASDMKEKLAQKIAWLNRQNMCFRSQPSTNLPFLL